MAGVSNEGRSAVLNGLGCGLLLGAVVLAGPAMAAEDLKAALGKLMEVSPRVNAARSDKEVSEARTRETLRRAWTPTLDLTAESGKQRYRTASKPDQETISVDRTVLRASQLLWDFGRSSRQVSEAEAVAEQTGAVLKATESGVLLEALTAHWSVVRASQVLEYARQSEESVRKQTQLENSLVELGKGYESNVLQAKVQLATAEARRVRAEGALEIAQARVAAVYGVITPQMNYGAVAVPVESALPKTLAEAREIALQNNLQIKVGVHRSAAIRERVEGVTSREFLPRLQLVAEGGDRHNIDGLAGMVEDRKLMLQLQYNFNAGLAGLAALDATKQELQASVSREVETRDLVLEQVSIAWRNLLVARKNQETLTNQVAIAKTFLEMATAERQLGRRSLLDVLTAEVSVINAQSDLATTEADVAIAGLTLLQAIGRLDQDVLALQPVRPVALALAK